MSLDLSACSDGELAALSAAGRQPAFAALMQRHQNAVYRLVRGHVGDPDEALDVTQETFTAAFLAIGRYDEARPMRAWLARIALNKCRDWGRRRAVRRFFSFAAPLSDAETIADPSLDAEAAAAERQEQEALWRAIASLPSGLKEPLLLRTVEGLSTAEAAGALGISAKAVEGRLYRARARLAAILSEA